MTFAYKEAMKQYQTLNRMKSGQTYLKLALCRSLPPSAAGTLPLRELPLRFLCHKFKISHITILSLFKIKRRWNYLTVFSRRSTVQGFQELIHWKNCMKDPWTRKKGANSLSKRNLWTQPNSYSIKRTYLNNVCF